MLEYWKLLINIEQLGKPQTNNHTPQVLALKFYGLATNSTRDIPSHVVMPTVMALLTLTTRMMEAAINKVQLLQRIVTASDVPEKGQFLRTDLMDI